MVHEHEKEIWMFSIVDYFLSETESEAENILLSYASYSATRSSLRKRLLKRHKNARV